MNSAALGAHSEKCDLETIAADLGITERGLRPTIKKLVDAGYFSVEGVAEYVYPTAKALRHVNPAVPSSEAKRFLQRLHRTT